MKVLDHSPGHARTLSRVESETGIDLSSCTRCRQPWGFERVEGVEMWRCDHCGYEAREKSSDYARFLRARQQLKGR